MAPDRNGWRVKKSNGTLFWRGLGGEILAETDLSGNNLREYIYFAGRRVARRDNNGTVYYFLQDHLGSTRIIANASGGVVRDSDYYPHGTEKLVSGTVDDPHKFAGMYLDSETGLYYTWFRMYSPSLGRWLAPDPIAGDVATPGSLNRYTYVLNNPVNYVDPLGLNPDCVATVLIETHWQYSGGSSPGVPIETTVTVLGVTCSGTGGRSGGGGGGGGSGVPSLSQAIAEVNRCAAKEAQKGSVASFLGLGENPVVNILLGNNVSTLSQLVLGPDREEAGGSFAGAVLGAKYSTPALESAAGALEKVVVEPTFQTIFSRSGTLLGETTFGRLLTSGLRMVGQAAAASLKPQILLDAGVYIGALYVCAQ